MAEKFEVDDFVIYGKNGLCSIKEIKKMRMANGPLSEYYVLSPESGSEVTIYVPCNKDDLVSKIRKPLTKAEIDEILEDAKKKNIDWIDNSNERSNYFKKIADSDNYRDWISMVSCIYLKKQEKINEGKHLSSKDESTLNLFEHLIEDEFCYSLNLSPKEVTNYIKTKLGID